MSYELQPIERLPDPVTGEEHPATPHWAATIRLLTAEVVARMRRLQALCDEVLGEEARRLGTKTLHLDGHKVVLTGGSSVEYDPVELVENLRTVDCPEERLDALIKETVTVTRTVNRSVLRQLAAANEDYKMAIELASVEVEKPWKASVQ
jgi:hypothetical protein